MMPKEFQPIMPRLGSLRHIQNKKGFPSVSADIFEKK